MKHLGDPARPPTLDAGAAQGISFSLLSAAECSRYEKAASKQKQGYQKYLQDKRHICVKDLIAKRRQEKQSNKLAEQLNRQKI